MSNTDVNIAYLFQSAQETDKPEEAIIEGVIPEWLKGTYLQVGPGKYDFGDFTMNYWLDGFAILSKFEINDSVVTFEKKFAQSEAYQKGITAGKPCLTEFGTRPPSEGSRNFLSKLVSTFTGEDLSDNCSASLFKIGTDLFAAAATCYFSRLNPSSLEISERYDAKKLFGQNGFGVHPLQDENGDVYNMGFSVLPTVKYNMIKIPAIGNGSKLEDRFQKSQTICSISSRWAGAFSFNHSFGMTENYIIFVEQPYVIKVSRVLAAHVKGYAFKDWMEWRPQEKNRFHIIEKSTGKVLNTEIISEESFFFLHFVNCFEDRNQIVIDITSSRDPFATNATALNKLRNNIIDDVETSCIQRFIIPKTENIKTLPEGENLVKYVPNCTVATAVRKGNIIIVAGENLTSRGIESTSINNGFLGKNYSFVYSTGTYFSKQNEDYAHAICKFDATTKKSLLWVGTESQFPGPSEPIFIPRGTIGQNGEGEDDGVVISSVSSANPDEKDFLVFLDAKKFVEIGRAKFNNRIPGGLHAIFCSN